MPIIDLTGQRFSRLVAVRPVGRYRGGSTWLCRCDCGEQITITSNKLRTGHTQSCGCLRRETIARISPATAHLRTHHGHAKRDAKSRAYNSWTAMIQRCTNQNFRQYNDYGGRGITIEDQRWLEFAQFLVDMGDPPPKMTLHRIDNDKGYFKANCKWATGDEQRANSRPRKPYNEWRGKVWHHGKRIVR